MTNIVQRFTKVTIHRAFVRTKLCVLHGHYICSTVGFQGMYSCSTRNHIFFILQSTGMCMSILKSFHVI